MNSCARSEALRDYAFDELAGADRVAMEGHVESCLECAAELHSIQLTTAALRSVPDREIPQRIAFVSDKLFDPSPWGRFFRGFFASRTQAGFAAACLLAGAIVFSAVKRPVEVRTVVASSTAAPVDVSQQIDAAVKKAVVQVHQEDARQASVALAAAETKHQREHQALLVTMQETVEVMQKRMGAYTSLASLEAPSVGSGQ
ncbi:MAG: putative transrane anti-sigma factor [Bryobacterales bacterium]|nr:putative transrane anti-sigma factor [Bryobacterales bacterium]